MESPINTVCSVLPFEVSKKVRTEYNSRKAEVEYLFKNVEWSFKLREYRETVEMLLALTIFYKRVVANFEGATQFVKSVRETGDAETIKIGSFKLDKTEQNKLLGVIMNYNKLLEEYGIPLDISQYVKTSEFLGKLNNLLEHPNSNSDINEVPF